MLPNFNKEFCVDTNANDIGVEAVLHQQVDISIFELTIRVSDSFPTSRPSRSSNKDGLPKC
ncbi:hypothetical protein EPI10_019914 [Gossypium australe]|uniref:Uncharacterized protein n=1 Tax=Gossypium australe TaxID=47621 RepID=A0A5B6WF29_9ROSI|nr:hypothetical protein EPI10_019914 [Gossypium australe]